jgi:GNAT superfamily N-acetyltransferase
LRCNAPSPEVRAAEENDAAAIARLATQLGYPSTAEQVRGRLAAVKGDLQHATFVAAFDGGDAVGWIQLSAVHSLAGDPRAEITGLVVEPEIRGSGVGRQLVERGEAWARERGLTEAGVHSNVIREAAHGFYLRLGYAVVKTQKVFRKNLLV